MLLIFRFLQWMKRTGFIHLFYKGWCIKKNVIYNPVLFFDTRSVILKNLQTIYKCYKRNFFAFITFLMASKKMSYHKPIVSTDHLVVLRNFL